jgi:hypothetical protein
MRSYSRAKSRVVFGRQLHQQRMRFLVGKLVPTLPANRRKNRRWPAEHDAL